MGERRSTPHLRLDEYRAILEVAKGGGSWKDALEAVRRASGIPRNHKTIQGAIIVAQELLKLGGGEIKQPTESEAEAIAEQVQGYRIYEPRVKKMASQYMLSILPTVDLGMPFARQQVCWQSANI